MLILQRYLHCGRTLYADKCFTLACVCVGSYQEDKGFCQEHKAHFNPVEASLLFITLNNDKNNINNSKQTAHTELFLRPIKTSSCLWKDRDSLVIDGAGGVNLINNRERCRHVAEWLTGVSLHWVPEEGLSTTGSWRGNWYCSRKDIHGVTCRWVVW